METDQNEKAVRFLLGKLTDEERADVEREFFRSTDSFENILIAENSLTDAYVSKRLSPDDRRLFEKRLLINPRQMQKTAFAGTLVKYASQQPVEDVGVSTSESKFSTIFARLFSGQPLFSYSLAAAVFLLLIGVVLWWTSAGSRRLADDDLAKAPASGEMPDKGSNDNTVEQILSVGPDRQISVKEITPETEHAKPILVTKPTQPEISRSLISTILLPLGSTRGAEGAKVFVVPKKTDLVNLKLGFESEHFSSYFAVVETVDGQQVWSGKIRKSSKNDDSNTVILTVPARLLPRGDYIITLKGLAKGGAYDTVSDYSFTIDRR